MYSLSSPIYALATPYSQSALAIVRCSGEGVIGLFNPYFSSDLERKKSGEFSSGMIFDRDGNKLDEAVVLVYREGHGYTLEEALEIIIHGSLTSIKRLSLLLESIGFRLSERGEFTYRAFMHGRIDLTQAEAVEEVVKSKSTRGEITALDRLEGSLKRALDDIKDDLVDIIASLEVYLDYGEDEIMEDFVFPLDRANALLDKIGSICSTYKATRIYSDGAVVVITGDVNAGKSSLFNRILRENRSIVSEVEGTTRDYIEEDILIHDLPVKLYDTAGIRESDSAVESEGIKRSKELLDKADLIIEVVDGYSEESCDSRVIRSHSKSDLYGERGSFSFSSLTGEGIDEILSEIERRLSLSDRSDESVPRIESERQRDALKGAINDINDAIENRDMSVDIISLYFQSALEKIKSITGEVYTDEILDRLFSSFCLGK